jgi:hypothetical protein
MNQLALLVPVAFGLMGCSATLVAASVGGVGTAAVATFDCAARLRVDVRDGRGTEFCGVPVIARKGDDVRELRACSWASLPEGEWRLHVVDASTSGDTDVVVEPLEGCDPHVYTVELTAVPTEVDETAPKRRTSPGSPLRDARGSARGGV